MYVAIEQKVKKDGTYEVSTYKKETRGEADKAFYSILAVASTSEHPIHSACILNEEGKLLDSKVYKHEVQPEPEPEPEPDPDPEPENGGEE